MTRAIDQFRQTPVTLPAGVILDAHNEFVRLIAEKDHAVMRGEDRGPGWRPYWVRLRTELGAAVIAEPEPDDVDQAAAEPDDVDQAAAEQQPVTDPVDAELHELLEQVVGLFTRVRVVDVDQSERFERLASLTAEILQGFSYQGHPGYPALRSSWIREDKVTAWRQELGRLRPW